MQKNKKWLMALYFFASFTSIGITQNFDQKLFEAKRLYQNGNLLAIPQMLEQGANDLTLQQKSEKSELLTYVYTFLRDYKKAEKSYRSLLQANPFIRLEQSDLYLPPPNGLYFNKKQNTFSFHPELKQLVKRTVPVSVLAIDFKVNYTSFFHKSLKIYDPPFFEQAANEQEAEIVNSKFLGYEATLTTQLFKTNLFLGIGFSQTENKYDLSRTFYLIKEGNEKGRQDGNIEVKVRYSENQKIWNFPISIKHNIGYKFSKFGFIGGLQVHLLRKSEILNAWKEVLEYKYSEILGNTVGTGLNSGVFPRESDTQNAPRLSINYSIFGGVEGTLVQITKNASIFSTVLYGRYLKSWVPKVSSIELSSEAYRQSNFREADFNFDYFSISIGARFNFYGVRKMKKIK